MICPLRAEHGGGQAPVEEWSAGIILRQSANLIFSAALQAQSSVHSDRSPVDASSFSVTFGLYVPIGAHSHRAGGWSMQG